MLVGFLVALGAQAQTCSSCYWSGSRGEYESATEKCMQRLGGHLVTISSEAENQVIKKMCGKEMCWIGFEETTETESWYWADGSRSGFRNWDRQYNQPANDKGLDERYAIVNSRRVSK